MHKVTNTNLENLSSSLFHHSIKLQPLKGDDIKLLQFKEEEIKENRIIQNEEKVNSESQLIEDIIKYQENIIKKKFKISSNPNSIIKFPIEKYITNDEDEYKLLTLINEQLNKNWQIQIDDNQFGIKIYKKELSYNKNPLIKAFCSIPFPLNIIMKIFEDLNFRLKWDKYSSKINIIEKFNDENSIDNYIIYNYMINPFERDFIRKIKIWKNYLGNSKMLLIHYKSVEHKNFPENKNIIRGNFIIGGYYFQEINQKLTKSIIVSHPDFKNNFDELTNEKVYEYFHNFIKDLINGCDLYIKSNNL